ncbi:MAG TPA: carboxypeptidase-like regulatory domain-containing protein, partial [Cyclobacteriaceae bacterium]|nr:carboxypeptidase-like regulatory domain-containing protein [Cyclobacteriaceae bacterium]
MTQVIRWLLLLLLFSETARAQLQSSISGRVIDAKTKEPLPGAVIFLAHTSIGVSADNNGFFILDRIPPGKYDLTATMLGYKLWSGATPFSKDSIHSYVVALEPSATLLDSVTV